MEKQFLWYANTIAINRILQAKNIVADHYDICVKSSVAKDNVFEFDVTINTINFKYAYEFSSNNCAVGKLIIKVPMYGEEYKFKVDRYNDTFRFSTSLTEYRDLFYYKDQAVIDINVVHNKKDSVYSLTVDSSNNNNYKASVVYCSAEGHQYKKFSPPIEMVLFAVSGAIDYDVASCVDIIHFGCNTLTMIIYLEHDKQIIVVDQFVNRQHTCGVTTAINSEFKQRYEWEWSDNDECFITKEIMLFNDKETVKRQYTIKYENGEIIINNKRRFAINVTDNSISFYPKD